MDLTMQKQDSPRSTKVNVKGLVKPHPQVQVAVTKKPKKDILTGMAEMAKAEQAQYQQESNQCAKEQLGIKKSKVDQKYALAKLKLENNANTSSSRQVNWKLTLLKYTSIQLWQIVPVPDLD
jgi:hypothetical protein